MDMVRPSIYIYIYIMSTGKLLHSNLKGSGEYVLKKSNSICLIRTEGTVEEMDEEETVGTLSFCLERRRRSRMSYISVVPTNTTR